MNSSPVEAPGATDPNRLQRLQEAGDWLIALQDPQCSTSTIQGWLQWCDLSPENLAEFQRLQNDWLDLDVLKAKSLKPVVKGSSIRSWLSMAAAATVAISVALYVRSFIHMGGDKHEANAVATTLISRAATLPDGSSMILSAKSRVNMNFEGPKRHLELSKGEAYFNVRHDQSRPFVVQAGVLQVTAVGTSFDVRRSEKQCETGASGAISVTPLEREEIGNCVVVTVEEGTVEVQASDVGQVSGLPAAAPALWRVEAGFQLQYSSRDGTGKLESVNPESELAWRNAELAYIREPLGLVIDNLNRFSSREVIVADPEVESLPFTGTAFATAQDDWLAGIEQAYPIIVKRQEGTITLHLR